MGQGVLELGRDVRAELRAWLDGLSGIARKVNEGAPRSELADVIASTTCDLTGYDFSAILLPNEQRTALLIVGSCGMRPEYIREINARRPIRIGPSDQGEAPTSRAFRYQRPVHIKDVWEATSCAPWEAVAHEQGNRSLLSLPLITSRGTLGALNCYTRVPRDFSGEDVVFMETLANQAALAIEAATLHSTERARIARLDSLNRTLREQQDVLRTAERAHGELMRLVLQDRDLDDLTFSLARTTSSIVLITDEHDTVTAASSRDLPEALLRHVVGAPEPPGGSAEDGGYVPFAHARRIPVSERGAGLPALVVPVLLAGEEVARLWAVRPRAGEPHTPAERRIVERAAIVVALVISKRRTAQEAGWRASRDFLDELLVHRDRVDASAVLERGRRLGTDLRKPHVLLVAGSVPGSGPASSDGADDSTRELRARVLLGRVQQVLGEVSVPAVATVRGGPGSSEAIVLFPAAEDRGGGRSPTEVAKLLVRALRHPAGRAMSVAISPECEKVDDYPSAYDSARRALSLATAHTRGDGIVDVRRLGVYRILLNVSQPAELARFAEDLLDPLERYEAKHGGELLRTLRVFLDAGGSATSAGEELFVHPNTVRYRIHRAEQLLGVALGKDEDRLQVKLALMIREIT
ncbi:MAG: GAF domain-containing protein [Streptosporangiales bacterium]|nr:GAF domain-containing protein [Streptosporangiales bacterium]